MTDALRIAQRRAQELEDELERRHREWSALIGELTALVTKLTDELVHVRREHELTISYAGSLANLYREETRRHVAFHLLTLRLARMGESSDPRGTADRRTVTLPDLIDQAVAALKGRVDTPDDGEGGR